jgi:hypothetical protein
MRTFAQRQKQPQNRVSSSLARSHPAALGPDHREHPILHLQRTISNQAVQRMLQTHAQELEAGFTGMATPRFGHDLSRIPIHRRAAGAIQTKLAINEPGDSYEQEADRVADQIMSVDEAHPQPKDDCACGGKCAECRASAMTPSTVQLSLSNSVRDIHAMPAPETSAQREAGTGELTVPANTIQRQIETKEEQGDCSGWESDCESFCRAAARQYWKDVDGVDPPLTEGLSECSRPRGGGQAFCTLRYKTGQVVRVALWQKKVIEVWRTDSSKKDPGYDAPSCDYTYSCSAKDRTIAFKKISCTDYRSPAPKRESQEPQMSSPIQRQSDRRSSFTEAPPMVEEILRSPGKPLDMATRAFMESRFRHDFGRVRVHTDARAALSANAIHARAYTAGSHVVFAGGQYAPTTANGRRLLAHELTHVVQQTAAGLAPLLQRAPKDKDTKDTKPAAPVSQDVAVVLGDDQGLLTEAVVLAPDATILHASSLNDLVKQLKTIKGTVKTLYFVGHMTDDGNLMFSAPGKKIFVTAEEVAAKVKGTVQVENINFQGCNIAQSPAEMQKIAGAVKATKATGSTCTLVEQISDPVKVNGKPILQRAQLDDKKVKAAFDVGFKKLHDLFVDKKKKCILNDSVDGYFQAGGRLIAYWANPGSMADDTAWDDAKSFCYRDLRVEKVDPTKKLPVIDPDDCKLIELGMKKP